MHCILSLLECCLRARQRLARLRLVQLALFLRSRHHLCLLGLGPVGCLAFRGCRHGLEVRRGLGTLVLGDAAHLLPNKVCKQLRLREQEVDALLLTDTLTFGLFQALALHYLPRLPPRLADVARGERTRIQPPFRGKFLGIFPAPNRTSILGDLARSHCKVALRFERGERVLAVALLAHLHALFRIHLKGLHLLEHVPVPLPDQLHRRSPRLPPL